MVCDLKMIRGAAILLILTLFMQANMGSIFGQFSSQERKDKAQMLKYMRGKLNLESTTVKSGFNERAGAWFPSSTKPEQIWPSKPLPITTFISRDKSKLLAHLRGMQTPSSISKTAYEHQESASNQDDDQYAKTRELRNDFVSAEESDESVKQPQVLWEKPAAGHVTYLQPAVKDKSGTCFWNGQQRDHAESDIDDRVSLKSVHKYEVGLDNWEQYIQDSLECIQKKFWISYEKIKKKICGMFGTG